MSFDPIADLQAFREKAAFQSGLASDGEQRLARALGIVHHDVIPGKDAFYPTKVLIDGAGRVLWAFAEDDLRVRLGPAETLAAVESALRL